MTVKKKYCPKCETDLPIDAFDKHSMKVSRLQTYCKQCFVKYKRERKYDTVSKYWTTQSELKFLDNIGRHGTNGHKSMRGPRNAKRCLEGYLKSMKYRSDWGVMDKEQIMQYVKDRLQAF